MVVGNEETAEEEKPKEAAKPMSLNLSLATKGLSGDQPKRAESYHPGQVTGMSSFTLSRSIFLLTNCLERLSSDGDFGIRYEFKETLGEGAFAVVKRAINRVTKEAVAVKIANKTGHWTEVPSTRFFAANPLFLNHLFDLRTLLGDSSKRSRSSMASTTLTLSPSRTSTRPCRMFTL